ncbi:hypothetical protein [Algiphilus sp.]|uniref:hypothetical protein n=1 Tax=Algiphilus sp. TaxID=1872431 RepID=UPI0025C2DBF5|nr:hypothetical protein [Algiphilus sp.]MCK5770938.1 hypothetical protein [Algiphilus sp.]
MARAGDSARAAADRVAQVDNTSRFSAEAALRAAAERAVNDTVDLTSSKYNLTPDEVRQYVGIRRLSASGKSATVQLRVRAIPIERFAPEIRMKRYTWRDKLGRSHSQELPSVYFQRYRTGRPRLVRPAFPLHQRTSGQLREGGVIRRRVGQSRDRLTMLRYYSFPRQWLRNELLPEVLRRAALSFDLDFRAAFRRGRATRGVNGRTRLHRND